MTRSSGKRCLWMIRSTGWFGAATWTNPKHAPPPPGDYCGYQRAGTKFDTGHEAAIQWSTGWNLGASLGVKGVKVKISFSASSQTGYDSNALMHFKFHRTGWICGTDHVPSKAGLLVVR